MQIFVGRHNIDNPTMDSGNFQKAGLCPKAHFLFFEFRKKYAENVYNAHRAVHSSAVGRLIVSLKRLMA